MNRSWVRFPQAAQIRPPGSGWAFLYVCAVSRCCLWLVAPRVFWAPRGLPCWAWPLCVPVGGGPPARSPHASLRLGVVDLEARPGPAATHRHRGQAIRRPPHRRQLVSRSQARHSRRPRAPRSGPATAHRHRGQAPRFAARPCPPVPPAPTGTAAWPSGPSAALRTGSDGGFAALEAGWRSIYGVSQL